MTLACLIAPPGAIHEPQAQFTKLQVSTHAEDNSLRLHCKLIISQKK